MSDVILPHNWTPRTYQLPCYRYMQGPEEGKRGVCVWHRRAGKDLFGINVVATKIPERVGTYWHMLPTYKQGRAIVWNGHTRDGRPFLDHFPPDLVTGKNGTEMRMTFYNGAHYQVVGTDDINSLVGTNPIGVIFSEYSLHDPGAWDYIRPILAENGGWALFIFTARGKNHGYHLLEMAKKNSKWFCEVLTAGNGGTKRPDGTPVISDEIIQDERNSGMSEEMIQQEFYCSFEAPMVGAYYGSQLLKAERENRITVVPYESKLPVDTYWDIGVRDATAIWFVQEYGFEKRLIAYYENSGEGLQHYARLLKGGVDKFEFIGEYAFGKHWGPCDLEVKEFANNAKSRREVAKTLGIRFNLVPQHEVNDGIESVRNILGSCWFDAVKCERGLNALRGYRKAYDEKNKCFRDHPLHDWTSHGSDGFRYFAMGRKERPKNKARQTHTLDQHDYLNARPSGLYVPDQYA